MSEDLVTRLRAVMDYSHTEIRFEAAAEIEKLRKRTPLPTNLLARAEAAEDKVAKLRARHKEILDLPTAGAPAACLKIIARQALTETEEQST